jgi:hypothetical protein
VVPRHLLITSVPLPLVEGALDVMLGDKIMNCIDNRSRHRDRCDQIIAGIGHCFALRGVGRYRKDVERRARGPRSQNDPQRGHPRREILPIVRRFGSMQFDRRITRIECDYVAFLTDPRPGQR